MKKTWLLVLALSGIVLAGTDPRIAFSALRDGRWQLFTCEADGTDTRKVAEGPWDVRDPAWFPDRSRIAVTTTSGLALIVDEATGTVSDTIRSKEYYLWNAAPAPDGKKVLLVAGRSAEIDQTFMASYDPVTRQLLPGLRLPTPIYQLRSHSPGGMVAFANLICGSACGKIIQEIWVHDPSLGQTYQVSLLNGLSRNPAWLPDGSGMLFDSNPNGASALYRITLGGKTPVRLLGDARGISQYAQPTVSPSGKRFAFIKDGLLHVAALDRPGKAATLLPFPDEPKTRIKDPAW